MPSHKKKTNDVPPDFAPAFVPPPASNQHQHSSNINITVPNSNRMQTRGATGNVRYQNAIICLNAQGSDGNTPSPEPPSLTAEQVPQKGRNIDRNQQGPNPPTKQTDAQQQKQREKNRQQRLARNKEEDFTNNILQMFDTDEESHSRPTTPPSGPGEPLVLSPLVPSIPPQYAPSRPRTTRQVAPVETDSRPPLEIAPISVPQKTNKSKAQDVWFFFSKGQDANSNTFCKLCRRLSKQDGIYSNMTSTGVLRGHLTKVHRNKYIEACQKNNWQPKGLGEITADGNAAELPRPQFTLSSFKTGLVEWIVGFDESINLVEYPPFRNWILLLRESLKQKDIPHRATVRRLISSVYQEYFKAAKDELRASEGMISLTVDGWDDRSMRAYLGVTAHFLTRRKNSTSAGGSLTLGSSLIAFLPTPGRHTGQVLAKGLLKVTDRAGITGRVRAITTDGAANMAAMLEDYQYLLEDRGLSFEAAASHVICFPHTFHLAVNRMIDALTSPEARQNSTAIFRPPIDDPFLNQRSLGEALERDPIAISRNIINAIRTSQIRRQEFLSMIEAGNRREFWKEGPPEAPTTVILPKLIPFRDVPHRWGSTYLSLKRMILLKLAIKHYTEKKPEYFTNTLTDSEWTVLEDICDALEGPFILQGLMSRERTPMLASFLPGYEYVLTTLEKEKTKAKYSYLRTMIQAGINDMRSNYNGHQFSKLLILAIFVHPSLRMRWPRKKWTSRHVEYARKVVLEELNSYRSLVTSPLVNDNHQSPKEAVTFKLFDNIWDDIVSDAAATSHPTVEEEFENYCHAGPWPNPEQVNIIQWWDMNSERYPTVYRLALDILPVQASSVAAERAFSSAAETDTPRRNKITPALMEELQLLKYMVNKRELDLTQHWHCTESEIEVENTFQDLVEGWVREDNDESSDDEFFDFDNVSEGTVSTSVASLM